MSELDRSLVVKADGQLVKEYVRLHLSGKESVGLFPMPYHLELWNLDDDMYLMLSRAKWISIERENKILAAGDLADVYRYVTEEGLVSVVVFSLGLRLWESVVSLSLDAGLKVSESVEEILSAADVGVSLLAFPGTDPVVARGQAIFGRAAESLSLSLSAARAEGYLVESGLCILPEDDLPVSIILTEEDMLMEPEFPSGSLAVFRLNVAGWPIGKKIEARWNNKSLKGIIRERLVDVDNHSGPWYSEILVEVRRGE